MVKDFFIGPSSFPHFLADVLASGRTFPGLIRIQFLVVSGTLLAWGSWCWLGQPLGPAGWYVLLFPSGMIVSLLLWAFLLGRIRFFFPFPTCRRGVCRTMANYSWDAGTIYGKRKWGCYIYQCACGDSYLRYGKRFMKILPPSSDLEDSEVSEGWVTITEANTRPYKRLTGFRSWSDDDDPSGYKG